MSVLCLEASSEIQNSGGDMHCSRDCDCVTCAITGIRISAVDDCSKAVVTMLEVRLDTAHTT